MRKLFIIIIAVLLAGCFGPVKMKPQKTYLLETVNPNTIHAKQIPVTLLVTMPVAEAGYDSSQMAYIKKPYRIQYYTQHQWVDSPGKMLLPLMVQSLTQTRHFKNVVAPPYTGALNLRLDTRVVELVQDFTQKPSLVHLKVRAQLVDTYTQKVIASRLFVVTKPAPSENAYGQVQAANQAVSDFLGQLSRFAVAKTYRVKRS